LDITGERKILTQRVSVKPVIGKNTAQIGMVAEVNSEQIPRFALPPAGGAKHANRGGHGLLLIGLKFHPNTPIAAHAQQIINHLKANRPIRIIEAANVAEHAEPALRVVAQECQHLENALARDADAELTMTNDIVLNH